MQSDTKNKTKKKDIVQKLYDQKYEAEVRKWNKKKNKTIWTQYDNKNFL